ncbi:hypothetical protein JCM8115_001989 [Rhodotorula mucilaginosa]|uniref:CsbD-like domain-containing protein n=1 Tax=Rhodotorula mucilaginosa TaxID=5537 RepID=A0A9P7B8R8_RHOMI|nr:hypothetical protein C6P46_004901 [Rhodotorula mucilaginosa]
MSSSDSTQQPTQLSGQLKQAQGALYQAVGAVPGTTESWTTEGQELQKEGEAEAEAARLQAKGEAAAERVEGKVQSAWGMVTGSQEHQNAGNLKAEQGEWKSSLADGTVPVPSMDRVKAKVESAAGMVTGDQQKQTEANLKAEKAEWTRG